MSRIFNPTTMPSPSEQFRKCFIGIGISLVLTNNFGYNTVL